MSNQQQPGYYQPQPGFVTPAPKKKRRVFLWVFLAIQVLFIIWIIAGTASTPACPSVASQVASFCGHHGWYPLYKSYADCLASYGRTLNDATNTGKGIGVALVIVLWCVVDFLVGGGYAIYRLASRRSS